MKELEPLALSIRDLCKLLGLSRTTIYHRIKEGTIPAMRVGSRILIPVHALKAWLSQSGSGGDETERSSKSNPATLQASEKLLSQRGGVGDEADRSSKVNQATLRHRVRRMGEGE